MLAHSPKPDFRAQCRKRGLNRHPNALKASSRKPQPSCRSKQATAVTAAAAVANDAEAPSQAPSAAALEAVTSATTAADDSSTKQWILSETTMQQFVQQNESLCRLLGGSEALQVEQLLDGVINMVYRVQGASGAMAIVKQALPYVRAVGASFPLSRARMEVEAAAMQLLHSCCPAHIPQLYCYHPKNSILAMQCAPLPHQKLLYCIRQGQILPELAPQLSNLLAAYLSHTSLQLMPTDQQATTQAQFANQDIVAANERVVLLSPFTSGDPTNRWSSPQLDADVHSMWSNAAVMSSAAAMLQLYRQQKEALIHNDLHAGNLLAAPGSLYLIDWEFATIGPIAFDLGCLMGNIMLAVLSLKGKHDAEQQQQQQQQVEEGAHERQYTRQQQAEWLLQVMSDVWTQFTQLYPEYLQTAAVATPAAAAAAPAADGGGGSEQPGLPLGSGNQHQCQQWQQQLLADSCGFAACCLIRLTIGIHHYPDIQHIQDNNIRVPVEQACLQLGQQLLLLRAAYADGSYSSSGSSSTTSLSSAAIDLQSQELSMEHVKQLVRDACEGWLK